MCNLCREGVVLNPKFDKKIRTVIHRIVKKHAPEEIIVFGSFARGDYHNGSDLDLIVVGDFKENFFDRIGKILDLIKPPPEIEPLVYSNNEFKKMLSEKRPFIVNALKEGIIAYESKA